MKIRTRSAPASTASGGSNHQDTDRLRNIRYQTSAYGKRVSTICQSARHIEGRAYLATMSFHAAFSAPVLP
jgi:hypothetical protein